MKQQIRRPLSSVAVLSLLGALPMMAAANDGPYIGLEGGFNYENPQNYRSAGESIVDDKFKGGWVGGLNAGYATSFGLRPELELDYRRNQIRKFEANGFEDSNVGGFNNAYTAFANLWYDIKTPTGFFSVVHPYVGGGAGAARVALRHVNIDGTPVTNDYDVVFAWQGGAGVNFDITPHLTASVDYRYVQTNKGTFATNNAGVGLDDVDARYRSNAAMFGIKYSFGSPKPAYVPPPPPPAPVQAYVPPPPPPPVLDSDGDGVPDNIDKCPGTPHGFKVDSVGCIIEQTVVLRAVNFEFNSDKLTMPAQETLDEVAKALIGQPSLNVQIGGYTDSKGSAPYNLNLSAKRAKSVKTYLVGKGVTGSNLISKGFGKASPVASNETEEGRAENRRVEFVVLNKPSTVKVLQKDSTAGSKAAAEGSEPKARKYRHKKKTTAPAAQ